MTSPSLSLPDGYAETLATLKGAVRSAHLRAHRSVNTELLHLYWQIGSVILDREEASKWGAKVVEHLAADLRTEFPHMTGLSYRNLRYMREFARAWPTLDFSTGATDTQVRGQSLTAQMLQQPVAQLPWGHITFLLNKCASADERNWYAARAVAEGWSRALLGDRIDAQLHRRVGAAPSNFDTALPDNSDLVRELIKDPYDFSFLDLDNRATERQVEDALVHRITDFLAELGVGFFYAGRQRRIVVGGDEFFIDLLFYQHRLQCFVVIELKVGGFVPEHAGKLNFYCNAVDRELRNPTDGPTIGILLCRGRNDTVVEYAVHGISTPLAVSNYRYADLPDDLRDALPSPTDLDALMPGGPS